MKQDQLAFRKSGDKEAAGKTVDNQLAKTILQAYLV